MPIPVEQLAKPVLFGRSSSLFTRVARIFAAETNVDYSFEILGDLLSTDPGDYGGNPAMKIPVLRTWQGSWFGALNICREFSRLSDAPPRTAWPEQLDSALLANTQELVLVAMSTEVALILAKAGGGAQSGLHHAKMQASLAGTLTWLEQNATTALAALPRDRDLSYLEVTLFCLLTHLEFRQILSVAGHRNLCHFRDTFSERPSAQKTTYRFDA